MFCSEPKSRGVLQFCHSLLVIMGVGRLEEALRGQVEALAHCLVEISANTQAGTLDMSARERLEANFSLAAGRTAFWSLPMLAGLITGVPEKTHSCCG